MSAATNNQGLDWLGEAFARVGWFIPPFIMMGALNEIARKIHDVPEYPQAQLEADLRRVYEPVSLAAMVLNRYPQVPIISAYAETIAEAVEAHFLGLDHIAVGGLIPVIEGAGRLLARERGIDSYPVQKVFRGLADSCKDEALAKGLGATDEVVSMLNSFAHFTKEYLYVDSTAYLLSDRTNRHGITHGAFTDADYGSQLNFYKIISAVDFLTFVASFGGGSWLGESPTEASLALATRWVRQRQMRQVAL